VGEVTNVAREQSTSPPILNIAIATNVGTAAEIGRVNWQGAHLSVVVDQAVSAFDHFEKGLAIDRAAEATRDDCAIVDLVRRRYGFLVSTRH